MLRESAKVQLRRFHWPEIASFVRHLSPLEAAEMRSKVAELAPTGFQIWGIPSGAAQVLKDMGTGDYLMLLESTDFRYVGQVIHRITENCWDLSDHIWGEQRFPIVILLQGQLVTYGWDRFVESFGFASNYHMRGNTMALAHERVTASPFE